ncbi:MAG: 50S ribosomal protein L25 [Elusimicrobia bacterium]|nr:50S ribosomal protein L25 [Elusimicrobiota bacterium]
MEQIPLKAEERPTEKRAFLNQLRKQGRVPAILYGHGPTLGLAVVERDLLKALRTRAGTNVLIKLEHPKGTDTVMLKEIQHHVVHHKILHVDFQRISLKEKIEIKVAVEVTGEAPGVKLQGGVLEHLLREISIRCLPTKIPDSVPVDVSHLEIGKHISVGDLAVPEGVEILHAPDQIIVHIVAPTKVEEPPKPEEAALASEASEPEVIARGKKEEEEKPEGAPAKPPALPDRSRVPQAAAPAKPDPPKKEGQKEPKK